MRFVSILALALACGGSKGESSDAGALACVDDSDCDDGVFCNGRERCASGICVATRGCLEAQSCDEGRDRCVTDCDRNEDADGDGARALECGGTDCDDANPDRYPGATEVCDIDGLDEDCDPATFGFRDLDGDGLGDASCCNTQGDGSALCGNDCDDSASGVSPHAPEVCNGTDDDCDGRVDEEVLTEFFVDVDGDGFGDAESEPVTACRQPTGYAPSGTDCDDTTGAINPGAVEVCDGATDEDCSGTVDDVEGGCECEDGTTRVCALSGRCEGATQACEGGRFGACTIQPVAETCNDVDDDCDGLVDEGRTVRCFFDGDNDGLPAFGTAASEECPDDDRAAAPFLRCPRFFTATEVTRVEDADCDDSRALETRPDTCHADRDGDGYGAGAPTYKCPSDACPSGRVANDDDCCDGDARVRPGSTMFFSPNVGCTNDTNCDGVLERRYGFYSCTRILGTCTGGTRGPSPYLRDDVGCGTISVEVDTCTEVSGVCRVSWSGYTGSGSDIRGQICR